MAIANPQSFNRYNYTQNDPVNFVDPSGLDFCLFGQFSIRDSWDGTGPFMTGGDGTYPGLCNAKSVGSSGGGGADGRGGGPGGGRKFAHAQSTREQRCLNAINDARSIKQRMDKTIRASLTSPGGFDQGHVDKYTELKAGLEDAVRRIEINCNNSEKEKLLKEGEMKGFTDLVNGKNPRVGDKIPIQETKIVVAAVVIVGALSPAFGIFLILRYAVAH